MGHTNCKHPEKHGKKAPAEKPAPSVAPKSKSVASRIKDALTGK